MTSLRRFRCTDLFRFNHVNLDHLTETVSEQQLGGADKAARGTKGMQPHLDSSGQLRSRRLSSLRGAQLRIPIVWRTHAKFAIS